MRRFILFTCLALVLGGCSHFQEDRCPPPLVDYGGDGPQGFRYTHPKLTTCLETVVALPVLVPLLFLKAITENPGFHYP